MGTIFEVKYYFRQENGHRHSEYNDYFLNENKAMEYISKIANGMKNGETLFYVPSWTFKKDASYNDIEIVDGLDVYSKVFEDGEYTWNIHIGITKYTTKD